MHAPVPRTRMQLGGPSCTTPWTACCRCIGSRPLCNATAAGSLTAIAIAPVLCVEPFYAADLVVTLRGACKQVLASFMLPLRRFLVHKGRVHPYQSDLPHNNLHCATRSQMHQVLLKNRLNNLNSYKIWLWAFEEPNCLQAANFPRPEESSAAVDCARKTTG